MQCTVFEATVMLERLDRLIEALDENRNLGTQDFEIIRDLLYDYREILMNTKVKI